MPVSGSTWRKSRFRSLAIYIMLLSSALQGAAIAAAQTNPYAPEVDYLCDDNVWLDVRYSNNQWVTCSVINNNAHDVTVKISEEWDHYVDGPFEISDWGYCMENNIGDEITVQGSSSISFCYTISADSHTPAGEAILTSTAEVIRYSFVIPCDNCEPVNRVVEVDILPWMSLIFDHESSPNSAYEYDSSRVACKKSDSSQITIDISADGNFVDPPTFEVNFDYRITIRDLIRDENVEYRESTFGKIQLDYDSELSLKSGETKQKTFTASWEIEEETDDYDITLRTYINIYATDSYGWIQEGTSFFDECPRWEGILPVQDTVPSNQSSGITVNLSSPFTISLSMVSVVLAAIASRPKHC